MGVRIGTRVGPVSVSTRVRSRDVTDGARGLGYLWGLAMLVLLLVTAAPVVPAAVGVWMLLSRRIIAKVFGLAFIAGAVVFAIWLWPREWVYVFRSDDLPDVTATSVHDAKTQLAADGFTHVTIADGSPRTTRAGIVRAPLTSSACLVHSTSPAPGDRTDKSATVTLVVRCPTRIADGYARMPDLAGQVRHDVRRILTRAGFQRIRLAGTKDGTCLVAHTTPAAGRIVRARTPVESQSTADLPAECSHGTSVGTGARGVDGR